MTLTGASPEDEERIGTCFVFQMEVMSNSDGEREICQIECDPPNEDASDELAARELGAGAWEFTLTLPAGFDGTEPVFRKFRRYGLDPEVVVQTCREAIP